MNQHASDYLQLLINSGQLTSTGVITYDGVTLTPSEQENVGPDKFGFYGEFTEFNGRRNEYLDAAVKRFAESDDPFKRKAAQNAPEFIVVFDNQKQVDELQSLFYFNHNRYLGLPLKNRKLQPFVDIDYAPIANHLFLAMGNFDFPETEGRDEVIADMDVYCEHYLLNKSKPPRPM